MGTARVDGGRGATLLLILFGTDAGGDPGTFPTAPCFGRNGESNGDFNPSFNNLKVWIDVIPP